MYASLWVTSPGLFWAATGNGGEFRRPRLFARWGDGRYLGEYPAPARIPTERAFWIDVGAYVKLTNV
jgi:hypothetical protein